MDGCTIDPTGGMEMPILTNIINHLFKDFDKHFVCCLHLTITLWVIGCGPKMLDMICLTKVFHKLIFEGISIVSDDGGRDSISTKNMEKDEFGDLNTYYLGEWYCFHPLGKVLSGGDNEGVVVKGWRVNLFD